MPGPQKEAAGATEESGIIYGRRWNHIRKKAESYTEEGEIIYGRRWNFIKKNTILYKESCHLLAVQHSNQHENETLCVGHETETNPSATREEQEIEDF
jgi:RES domain-containing protein